MNWDDLKLFLEVGRKGSLSAAADSVGLDHTTLSRRLHRLEGELGATLFIRSRSGHALTADGQRLMHHAEQVEVATLQARQELTGETQSLSGQIRLSTTEGFGAHFVAPRLGPFADAHPQIQLDLVASAGLLSLSKREADMGILLARPRQGRLIAEKLCTYTLRLYAHRDYLKRHGSIERVEDLDGHRLTSYVDDLIYAPELRYFEETIRHGTVQIRSSSIMAQFNYVTSAQGIGILHDFMARGDGTLIPLLTDEITINRSFWLALHEDVAHLARIRALRAFLHDLVRENQDLLSVLKG